MDSDGFFTIKRGTYGVRVIKDAKNPTYSERVGLKQTAKEAVGIIYKLFGGYYRIEKPSTKNGKPLHAIELRNKKAHNFIKQIYPYLRIKKRQAEILLKLRESIENSKKKPVESFHKDRWGNITKFTRYSVSDEALEFRESLIQELKKLNDSRDDEKHQPIPWR